jgi:hypothetical protein
MRRNGAILACFLFLLTMGFSPEAKARGFLESVFGYQRQDSPAQIYFAPNGEVYNHRQAHRRDVKRGDLHHRSAARFRSAKNHVVRDTPARARVSAHRKLTQRRMALAIRAASPSSPSATPPASERPCCGNAQEAINQIINNDRTLRPGDAYMSHEGLRVYVGERKKNSQFVAVDHARHIGAGLKQRLKEVGATPHKTVRAPDEKARNQGRELQPLVARPTRGGDRLVDGPGGRPIRLVGGFAK